MFARPLPWGRLREREGWLVTDVIPNVVVGCVAITFLGGTVGL